MHIETPMHTNMLGGKNESNVKLQQDAINSSASVIDLLRTTKLIAVKLDIKSGVNWIDREFNGYHESSKELPEYRRLVEVPKIWNPYHGRKTINFPDEKHSKFFSLAPLGQALVAVESGLGEADGTCTMLY